VANLVIGPFSKNPQNKPEVISMTDYLLVVTTTETKDEAQKIAQVLVEQRLAGCVQVVGPITSTYWWQDQVESAEEWLCFIKSSRRVYPELEAAISEVHPYDTPEIIATPIVTGSRAYLSWLAEELK
jgi:periplasmic divalent cation tolerance protein